MDSVTDVVNKLDTDGYAVSGVLFSGQEIAQLVQALPSVASSGTRTLLQRPVFRRLAALLRTETALAVCLTDLVAVEGIFFQKSLGRNWSVKPHRDSVIPISGDGPWRSAGSKEGMACVHAPLAFMRRCVAVRLALDPVPDGDIRVEPGTHRGSAGSPPVTLVVPQGGALLLRPSLRHSSAKLVHSEQRRVVHLLFAPRDLPASYRWYHEA
ncbi:MAG: hypothetical protein AAGH76_15095 [Pseudomonadota bacterium]